MRVLIALVAAFALLGAVRGDVLIDEFLGECLGSNGLYRQGQVKARYEQGTGVYAYTDNCNNENANLNHWLTFPNNDVNCGAPAVQPPFPNDYTQCTSSCMMMPIDSILGGHRRISFEPVFATPEEGRLFDPIGGIEWSTQTVIGGGTLADSGLLGINLPSQPSMELDWQVEYGTGLVETWDPSTAPDICGCYGIFPEGDPRNYIANPCESFVPDGSPRSLECLAALEIPFGQTEPDNACIRANLTRQEDRVRLQRNLLNEDWSSEEEIAIVIVSNDLPGADFYVTIIDARDENVSESVGPITILDNAIEEIVISVLLDDFSEDILKNIGGLRINAVFPKNNDITMKLLYVRGPEADWGDADTVCTYNLTGTYNRSDFNGAVHPQQGANHNVGNVLLGDIVDRERNGTRSVDADGDDTTRPGTSDPADVIDDEDGVTFPTGDCLVPGLEYTINICTKRAEDDQRGPGHRTRLSAWIDQHGDGSFDSVDQIFDNINVTDGCDHYTFVAHDDLNNEATDGMVYARFRISTYELRGPCGHIMDGEVEDYRICIKPPSPPDAQCDGSDSDGLINSPVTFTSSSSSDENDDIVSYTWDFDDGTPAFTTTSVTVTHTYTEVGTYNPTLTVTDSTGRTDVQANCPVVIKGPPKAVCEELTTLTSNHVSSTINGLPICMVGQACEFDGTGSTDPDDDIVSYSWNFGDSSPDREGDLANNGSISHVYNDVGTYELILTVTDATGNTDTSGCEIRVEDVPTAECVDNDCDILPEDQPNLPENLVCYTGTQFEPIMFTADESSVDSSDMNYIVSYTWTWGDGSPDNVTTTPFITHTYNEAPKYYDISVTVLDAQGRTSTKGCKVFVEVPFFPPMADCGGPYEIGCPGKALVFNGSASSDRDEDIVNYFWDFGDNNVAEGESLTVVSHTYVRGGLYRVCLTVTDSRGLQDKACCTAQVDDETCRLAKKPRRRCGDWTKAHTDAKCITLKIDDLVANADEPCDEICGGYDEDGAIFNCPKEEFTCPDGSVVFRTGPMCKHVC